MGAFISYLRNLCIVITQAFPPKTEFSVDQIPDLTGQVIIVTGGNTGIGKETVKALLQHNAKVYLAARNKVKAEAAIADLKVTTGKEAIFLELDLASLASFKKAADEFLSKEPALHVLFNNAGVMFPPVNLVTADGYDLQFGTNVLGHFYFTKLLLPALIAGKDSAPDHHARVITTSSAAAYLDTLHWDTFKDGPARRRMRRDDLYHQSKHGNVVVARETAKRYADQGIISISLNPGNIQSELQRYLPAILPKLAAMTNLSYPTPYGALTQLWAGTMPGAVNYNGEYLIPWARPGKCREEAYDPEVGEKLWNWLEAQVKFVSA